MTTLTQFSKSSPSPSQELWVEADVMWGQKAQFGARDWCAGGCNGVGGSDEAHAAYLMVTLILSQEFHVLLHTSTLVVVPSCSVTLIPKETAPTLTLTSPTLQVEVHDATGAGSRSSHHVKLSNPNAGQPTHTSPMPTFQLSLVLSARIVCS